MAKCINFELSKRLYDNWLLSFNWLDYSRYFRIDSEWNSLAICKHNDDYNEYLETYKEYPSLTLEEAIEFLPKILDWFKIKIDFENNNWNVYYFSQNFIWKWTTLLEAIEKMIEYLLDNNLI